jgi:signal transduction histidine kinase
MYGGLFLVSGAVLLAITYLLVRRSTGQAVLFRGAGATAHAPAELKQVYDGVRIPPALEGTIEHARAQAQQQHAAELHELLVQSGIALAIMAGISILLGWLIAGRALRPIRNMTRTTRQISSRNLHERLAIEGPRDELKDLADTFDGLLARIETAFDTQRRFVANAAHELRTPLTLQRTLVEENLGDPAATIDSYRALSRRLLRLGDDQERMLEALLTLASSERGVDRREPVDLARLAGRAVASHPDVDRLGLRIDATLVAAPTAGDRALLERLVVNLVDNAVRHNVPGGDVDIATGVEGDHVVLSIANSGAVISPEQVQRLFEPFQRLGPDRTCTGRGHHGLGLSIVAAIATAHGACVTTHPRRGGGLSVRVDFPYFDGRGALT